MASVTLCTHTTADRELVAVDVVDLTVKTADIKREWLLMPLTSYRQNKQRQSMLMSYISQSKRPTDSGSGRIAIGFTPSNQAKKKWKLMSPTLHRQHSGQRMVLGVDIVGLTPSKQRRKRGTRC